MAEFYNRTRRSESIPRRLLRQGRPLAIPVYWMVKSSNLGLEGIRNSGSYHFADHIYRNEPSGQGPFGRWLDARFLAMPAVRSFRSRFLASRDALAEFLVGHQAAERRLDVVSAPCGIPRELAEGARSYRERTGRDTDHVTFHGVDLDSKVLEEARGFARANGLANFVTHQGDALVRSTHADAADFITCTGLAEFLDDEKLGRLYQIFYDVLRPGGMLVTSGMRRKWVSEYFLRLAELKTHNRDPSHLEKIASGVPFAEVRTRPDEFNIQTILVARK